MLLKSPRRLLSGGEANKPTDTHYDMRFEDLLPTADRGEDSLFFDAATFCRCKNMSLIQFRLSTYVQEPQLPGRVSQAACPIVGSKKSPVW